MIFWIIIFPIILCTFFYLGFTNISSADDFKMMNVGVVTGHNNNNNLIDSMKEVEINNIKTFTIKDVTKEGGIKLLNDKKIAGLINFDDQNKIELIINNNELDQMVLQEFLTNYQQATNLMTTIIKTSPNQLEQLNIKDLDFNKQYVINNTMNEKNNNPLVISFYTCIAMTCLYGAFCSAFGIITIQPNLSSQGLRLSVSPYRKYKILIADFIANYLFVSIALVVLLSYMINFLHIDFGNQILDIGIICAIGGLCSTAFGYFVGILTRANERVLTGIIITITMLWCFLAGMMSYQVKYLVENIIPAIKFVNPIALISDSLYSVYYYGDLMMAIPYLLSLSIMFVLFMIASLLLLRGNQYDNI
ncbi:MAG: ABC transporter permease [Bacilli bacterium]|jgi:ABC-2 type transport system permease protein|nr:ABC transporter permease [Bacilli bacterium]